jgi:CRISPR/Cas system-associated exonuclease Cas4 (RecB family)
MIDDDNRFRDILIEGESDSSFYSLIRHLEEHITRHRISGFHEPHLYPSEASVKIINPDGKEEVLGTCLRQAYLRFTGQASEAPNARSEFIFKMGDMVESVLIEQLKQMGVWVGDDVEFYNKEYNLKGKLDVICKNPNGELYGVEIKSFYGYYAQKQIIGNKSSLGRPKDSQLLQTIVYANEFKNQLNHFRMLYLERGNAARNEFIVSVRPVNGIDRVVLNGEIEQRFTIADIYNRYKLLDDYIQRKEVPPSEFKLYYDDDEMEYHYKKGDVSKTDYDKFKRNNNNRMGNWQCSYCPYKKYCWSS